MGDIMRHKEDKVADSIRALLDLKGDSMGVIMELRKDKLVSSIRAIVGLNGDKVVDSIGNIKELIWVTWVDK